MNDKITFSNYQQKKLAQCKLLVFTYWAFRLADVISSRE